MKKKTLIVAIVLSFVLLCSSLLTGCASENIIGAKETSWLDAYKNDVDATINISELSEVELDGDFVTADGNFFYTAKAGEGVVTYKVYDIRTLSVVYTYTDSNEGDTDFVEFEFYDDADFFVLTYKVEEDYKSSIIYDGTAVVTEDGNRSALFNGTLFDAYGFFNFDGDCYRQTKDGVSLVKAKENGTTAVPEYSIIICGEKYFWAGIRYSAGADAKQYVAFDLSLNPVTEYIFPSYAQEPEVFVLAKDRVIIQYLIPVDTYSADYTYIDGANKYDVYQSVYNTEAKSETVVDLKGIVTYSYILDEQDAYQLKENRISAMVDITPIENKRLNPMKEGTYNVNENGGIIEKMVAPGGFEYVRVEGMVAKDRFVLENSYIGAKQLVDQKGKVIATFTGSYNSSYFVKDKTIYDLDGKEVVTVGEDDQISLRANVAFIKKPVGEEGSGKYDMYLLVPGSAQKKIGSIGDAEATEIWSELLNNSGFPYYYVITTKVDDAVKYVYYDLSGTELGRFDSALMPAAYAQEGIEKMVVLFAGEVDGAAKYYSMTISR